MWSSKPLLFMFQQLWRSLGWYIWTLIKDTPIFLDRVIQKGRLDLPVHEYPDNLIRKTTGKPVDIVKMEDKEGMTLFPLKTEAIVKNSEFWFWLSPRNEVLEVLKLSFCCGRHWSRDWATLIDYYLSYKQIVTNYCVFSFDICHKKIENLANTSTLIPLKSHNKIEVIK